MKDGDKLGVDPCNAKGGENLNMCGFANYSEAFKGLKTSTYYDSYCGPADGADTVLAIAG